MSSTINFILSKSSAANYFFLFILRKIARKLARLLLAAPFHVIPPSHFDDESYASIKWSTRSVIYLTLNFFGNASFENEIFKTIYSSDFIFIFRMFNKKIWIIKPKLLLSSKIFRESELYSSKNFTANHQFKMRFKGWSWIKHFLNVALVSFNPI